MCCWPLFAVLWIVSVIVFLVSFFVSLLAVFRLVCDPYFLLEPIALDTLVARLSCVYMSLASALSGQTRDTSQAIPAHGVSIMALVLQVNDWQHGCVFELAYSPSSGACSARSMGLVCALRLLCLRLPSFVGANLAVYSSHVRKIGCFSNYRTILC